MRAPLSDDSVCANESGGTADARVPEVKSRDEPEPRPQSALVSAATHMSSSCRDPRKRGVEGVPPAGIEPATPGLAVLIGVFDCLRECRPQSALSPESTGPSAGWPRLVIDDQEGLVADFLRTDCGLTTRSQHRSPRLVPVAATAGSGTGLSRERHLSVSSSWGQRGHRGRISDSAPSVGRLRTASPFSRVAPRTPLLV
jgi:hypothetical protein